MDDMIRKSHNRLDARRLERSLVEGAVRGNDAQARLGTCIDALNVGSAAKRLDQGARLFRGQRVAKLRLDARLRGRLDRRWRLNLVRLRARNLQVVAISVFNTSERVPKMACTPSPTITTPPRPSL